MQLRIAIASTGLISNDFMVSLTTLNPEHYKVVAVAEAPADPPGAAKEFAKKFGIAKAYGKLIQNEKLTLCLSNHLVLLASYHELAKDPEVDLVYIGRRHFKTFAC